jgi:hypothetical protein
MAAQLAPVASSYSPVCRSTRRVSIFPSLPDARIQDIGPITRYSTSDKITVHLQDGRTIEDIDIVLFETGYHPNVPYLQILHPESCTLTPLTLRPHASPPHSRRFQTPRAQSHTRVHGRNYILHTFPSRRPRKHLAVLAWSRTISIPEEIHIYERERLNALVRYRAEADNPSLSSF